MVSSTDGCFAGDAAAFVRGNLQASQCLDGDSEEIDRQASLLIDWGTRNSKVFGEDYFSRLNRLPTNTAEHEIFYRAHDKRAVKRTHAGSFGVTPDPKGVQKSATPYFYLIRVRLMNHVFKSHIRFEGIAFRNSMLLGKTGSPQPCMVISQPWYESPSLDKPHPSEKEIDDFMESLGFLKTTFVQYGWEKPSEGLLVVDARPDNFMNTNKGIVPIDLVISQDFAEVHEGMIYVDWPKPT